jgi:hypothetical protein
MPHADSLIYNDTIFGNFRKVRAPRGKSGHTLQGRDIQRERPSGLLYTFRQMMEEWYAPDFHPLLQVEEAESIATLVHNPVGFKTGSGNSRHLPAVSRISESTVPSRRQFQW